MCVQIGNRLFAELRIAHSGLRKGRRDGPDSIAIFARKVSVSNGIHSRSSFGVVGWVYRQEYKSLREFTRDCERFGEIGQENCRCMTGDGRLGEGRRRRAGGAQAQRDAKGCMNSCDVLLCILSISCRCGRRVSKWREVARIAALIHVLLCSFCKSFCGLAQRVAPAGAASWSCTQVCSVKKYTFVKVQRWFAVALDFQLWIQPIRLFRLLQGGKGTGHTHLNLYANPVGIPNRRT